MNTRRITALFVVAVMVVGSFLALPTQNVNTSGLLSAFNETYGNSENATPVESSIDYSKASDNAIVERNLLTGEVKIIEPENNQTMFQYLNISNTEPIIPDGVEIAPPPSTPRNIIDGTRSRITNVNTYPYCAMAYLSANYPNGTAKGSGAFIGETALLTAAHVINHPEGGYSTSMTVYPGGTGSKFGSTVAVKSYTPVQWDRDYSETYDYGIVVVAKDLGVGAFGTRAEPNANLTNKNVWAYGYPGDKPVGQLWYDSGSISSSISTRTFRYSADAVAGDSGGPVVLQSGYLYIVGIVSKNYSSSYNQAMRVTSDVVDIDNEFS